MSEQNQAVAMNGQAGAQKKMKLSSKLFASMGLLVAMILFIGLLGLYEMDNVNNKTTEITDNWLPALSTAREMNTKIANIRICEIRYAYSSHAKEQEDMNALLLERLKLLEDAQSRYDKLVSSPEEEEVFREFMQLWKDYLAVHKNLVEFVQQGNQAEATALIAGKSKATFDAAGVVLQKLVDLNAAGANAASAEADEIYNRATMFTIIILAAAVIIGSVMAMLIVRGTSRQLGSDPGELEIIAQKVIQGDYNVDDGSPHIGVYGNIIKMVASLKENIEAAKKQADLAAEQSHKAEEAMHEAEKASAEAKSKTESMLHAADRLEEVASAVSSASTELAAQIEESERGSADQAARVTETATAMEEMNSSVIEVAKNAGAASEVSGQTRQKADAGAEIVHKAVESIQMVQTEALALKADMGTLSEHAKAISQIMSVISDIADQTNLLALNAAIEAARAGEAGRGFAVVADEVRKLAEKSMASTTDVGNAINAIQHSVTKSTEQVDRAVKAIEQATEFANTSGEALAEIVQMADDTAGQVEAIATASEQQSAASEEINRSLSEVNSIAAATARAMQEATQAVSDLAEQAQALAVLIDDMKRG